MEQYLEETGFLPTTNSHTLNCASKPLLPSHASFPAYEPDSLPPSVSSSYPDNLLAPRDPCTDIAATDPENTTRLWKTVRSCLGHTSSSRGERPATPVAIELVTSASSLTSGHSSIQSRNDMARVTDADFTVSVLEPYGITIEQTGVSLDLRKYFNILDLPSNPEARLNVYKKSFALEVWLEPDGKRIRREYKAMQAYKSNAAEYSATALRDIFLDEPRYPWLLVEEGAERWLPVRMLQLDLKPQDKWYVPPLIGPLNNRYDWDIRPDCTYHVSLQAFALGFRSTVPGLVSVVQTRAFLPYLTIEFEKDEDSLKNGNTLASTNNRLAVASAIALYNRYRLKREALDMSGDEWSEKHRNHMRHYGITLAGSSWRLWCTVPKAFPEWTGCNMSMINIGDCCVLADVQKLVSAINDIHYWGLEVHGRSCKADIHAKIRCHPNADSFDIEMLEDMRADSNSSPVDNHTSRTFSKFADSVE